MARLLSRRGHDNVLQSLMQVSNLTPELIAEVDRIRSDFAEREGVLAGYGISYDGEEDYYDTPSNDAAQEDIDDTISYGEPDNPDVPDDSVVDTGEGDVDYRQEYENLKKLYVERFFGGDMTGSVVQPPKPVADNTPNSYRDLLMRD